MSRPFSLLPTNARFPTFLAFFIENDSITRITRKNRLKTAFVDRFRERFKDLLSRFQQHDPVHFDLQRKRARDERSSAEDGPEAQEQQRIGEEKPREEEEDYRGEDRAVPATDREEPAASGVPGGEEARTNANPADDVQQQRASEGLQFRQGRQGSDQELRP